MKHKPGDKVKIRSLEWYEANRDAYGRVYFPHREHCFTPEMKRHCGKEAFIVYVYGEGYRLDIDGKLMTIWTDEMFEPNNKNDMKESEQNKQWNNLSSEEQQSILNTYKKAFDEPDNFFALEYQAVMNDRYGTHNLNPKPIRTWKDVKNYLEIIPDFKEIVHNLDVGCCDRKVIDKIIATYKISRIIELGYGGLVSDERNKDRQINKFVIVPCEENDGSVGFEIYTTCYSVDKVTTFHSISQAEEFMKYESNLRLLSQYYLV